MFAKNRRGFYEFTNLVSLGLANAVSTRLYGNLAYKHGEKSEVDANRKRFANNAGFDLSKIAQMGLVHGTDVKIIDKNETYENVDGLITKAKLPLFLLTGDCAPIIIFDPAKKVVGLVHSGWKGTVGKISLIAIAKMMASFDCKIDDIVVAIGPSVEKCCYIKPKFGFTENLPEWSGFYENLPEGKMRIDLNGFTISQLIKVGIKMENIFYSNFCTKTHRDEFFSYQLEQTGEEKPGRFATIVQMK